MRLKTTKKPKKQPLKCSTCEAEFILQGHAWKDVDIWNSFYQIRCPYCSRWIKVEEVKNGK